MSPTVSPTGSAAPWGSDVIIDIEATSESFRVANLAKAMGEGVSLTHPLGHDEGHQRVATDEREARDLSGGAAGSGFPLAAPSSTLGCSTRWPMRVYAILLPPQTSASFQTGRPHAVDTRHNSLVARNRESTVRIP